MAIMHLVIVVSEHSYMGYQMQQDTHTKQACVRDLQTCMPLTER